jgi:oligosaccharide repeat unit polymerase
MIISGSIIFAVFATLGSSRLMRSLFNPISLFAGIWSLLVAVYSLNLLPYYEIEANTWLLLALSGLAFCSGCASVAMFFLRRPARLQPDLTSIIDLRALVRVTIMLYLMGMILLTGYVLDINSRFTFERFLAEPWHLRAAIMQGDVSWFLRYFYFTMPAAVLAFVHLRLTESRRFIMRFIVVTSLVYGMATTGRTAVIWLLAWIACVYIYMPNRGNLVWQKAKAMGALGLFALVSLLFFIAAGSWVGRTYYNSELARSSAVGESTEAIIVPYQYFTSNIPAFQNLLLEEPAYTYGQYTLLPVIKTLAAFTDEVQSLTEVSEFTKTPFLGNTYTYLWPYYQDFGLPGLLVCPFLLGAIVTLPFLRMKVYGAKLSNIFINSLLATAILFTFIANWFTLSPTWWFFMLAPVIGRICRKREPVVVVDWETGAAIP